MVPPAPCYRPGGVDENPEEVPDMSESIALKIEPRPVPEAAAIIGRKLYRTDGAVCIAQSSLFIGWSWLMKTPKGNFFSVGQGPMSVGRPIPLAVDDAMEVLRSQPLSWRQAIARVRHVQWRDSSGPARGRTPAGRGHTGEMRRDAKGRYTDLEIAAVEAYFDHRASDQAELDWLMDHFNAQAIVLGIRRDNLAAEIEAGMIGFGEFLWRRFPRTCRIALRVTERAIALGSWLLRRWPWLRWLAR